MHDALLGPDQTTPRSQPTPTHRGEAFTVSGGWASPLAEPGRCPGVGKTGCGPQLWRQGRSMNRQPPQVPHWACASGSPSKTSRTVYTRYPSSAAQTKQRLSWRKAMRPGVRVNLVNVTTGSGPGVAQAGRWNQPGDSGPLRPRWPRRCGCRRGCLSSGWRSCHRPWRS